MPPPGELRLTLLRGSVFNLLGQGLPIPAALVSIPVLIGALGNERFGILTLAWALIGYFGLFDLGLGRALTQIVSEDVGSWDEGGRQVGGGRVGGRRVGGGQVAPQIAWRALGLMCLLGVLGGGVVALSASWLVRGPLNIAGALQREVVVSLWILAAGIPFVVVTAGLGGVLAAFQRFGLLNALRAPMGVLAFLAPLAVLPFSKSLTAVVAALVVVRVAAFVAHLIATMPFLPESKGKSTGGGEFVSLIRQGGWMTVSNIISPLMLYLDRFVIAAILTATAVAYYATPYEVITRALIVTGAVSAVLFPAVASSYQAQPRKVAELLHLSVRFVAGITFPLLLLVVLFAKAGLTLWLGESFALESYRVLQILAIGVFVNGFGQLFYAVVQGMAKADITAKLHLAELAVYLPLLWYGVANFGIVGAAWVWTARVSVDTAMLLWSSGILAVGAGIRSARIAVSLSAMVSVLIAAAIMGGS